MNLTTKFIITTFLIFSAKLLFAQTSANKVPSISKLICKEWRLVSFEEDDGKFEPSPDQIGDRMKFELNHKLEYVEISKYKTGIWKYDSKNKLVTIINDLTKEKKDLKVVKITNTDLIFEYEEEGSPLKMYMAAVGRKKRR